ncbi:TM2 domain-containing protein [Gracilimonas amylolytica]|uniref:TM2 domain-containing protein n=1 Tax=Gracilimonas amylolytica TaxID=1749045 RepID=UPI000CD9C54B|nr:TM2 domain-containing protein [Gracilimonas amylolytica]
MANILDHLPELEGDESLYVGKMLNQLNEDEAEKFANVYRSRRKDPQTILITCLLGFFLIAGVHRLILNQIGMGILYILTGGLCVIGTIVDLINYKDLTFQYNRNVAKEVHSYIK